MIGMLIRARLWLCEQAFILTVALVVIVIMAVVGNGDYEEAKREEVFYCHNVATGAWPDYRGDFTRMCAAQRLR